MKKRVTIYIDGGVWEDIKNRAWESRRSASVYVEDLLRRPKVTVREPTEDEKESTGKPLIEVFNESNSADIDLAEAQAKLDAEKRKRNIKEEKVSAVRSQIRSYSKAQQLGKKHGKAN